MRNCLAIAATMWITMQIGLAPVSAQIFLPAPQPTNNVPFGGCYHGDPDAGPVDPPPAGLNAFPPPGTPPAPYMVQNIGAEPRHDCTQREGFLSFCEELTPPCPYVWAGLEGLYWWVKPGPLPVPVVTTSTNPAAFGTIGLPTTQVLFGNANQNYGGFAGIRATAGCWIDMERLVGIEATAFILERRSTNFSATAPTPGNPSLYVPANLINLGTEGVFIVSDPRLGASGSVSASTDSRLWGGEAHTYGALVRCPCWNVDLLMGFRFLDLDENFNLSTQTNLPRASFQARDHFGTHNYFYGGQGGAKVGCFWGPVAFDVIGKCACGYANEIVNIQGSTVRTIGGVATTFAGGAFAQPSNIGQQTRGLFAVVPSAQAKLSVYITSCVRATVAYDFLYWDRVVRPGNQIDRFVNTTQFAGGALVGPARPAPLFRTSDFFAHGISSGLEIRY